ncbi:Protein-glutamate methylesterase/protein-glutamine glutaminase [Streptomyces tendae]
MSEQQGPGRQDRERQQPGGPDPIKVMVVDDHPMWRDAVARDLAESGFDVVATASDGDQAVRRAWAAAPDVLVLDLNLPGKPGVQVCKEVVGADPRAAPSSCSRRAGSTPTCWRR